MTGPSNSPRSSAPCLRCGASSLGDATHCPSCGQAQIPSDPPEAWIGRVIDGKYEIDSVLGVGGMGMVFAARRVLVGDIVALKVLFPRFMTSPLQRRLFRDEAIAAARLSHPNVVTVFDAEPDAGGRAYLAMELLRGRTLKALLQEEAPVSPEVALPIMIQVAEGLEAAHQAKIVHRDLKPDNIFLEERPGRPKRVKLVDFGIAAMQDAGREDEQRIVGTLRYMAPEQCMGGPLDARADLYAFGVVMYEMLTRQRATARTISAVLSEEVKPPNVVLAPERHLPLPLEDLLMRLLAKRAEDRPGSAAEVALGLRSILSALRGEGEAIGSQPTSMQPSLRASEVVRPPERGSRGLWIGLLVATLVGMAGGIAWGVLS